MVHPDTETGSAVETEVEWNENGDENKEALAQTEEERADVPKEKSPEDISAVQN